MYTNKLLTSDVIASKQYALHSAIDYLEKNMEKLDALDIFYIIEFKTNSSPDYLGFRFLDNGDQALTTVKNVAYSLLVNDSDDADTLASGYWCFGMQHGNNEKMKGTEYYEIDKEAHRKIIFDEHTKLLVELNKLNEFLEVLASQGY